MFHVLLIGLHDSGTYGHRCLSSCLRSGGVRVSNIFFRRDVVYQDAAPVSEIELAALARMAGSLAPDMIGVNIHSSFGHHVAERVIPRVRAAAPSLVLGGVHPTVLPEYCLETLDAQYVCVGEGEESMLELCRRLAEGLSGEDIPGIMTRQAQRFVPRPPPGDLDALPAQDIGQPDMYSILSNGSIVEGDPLLALLSYPTKASRGCPFQCAYCSVPQLRSLGQPGHFYRLRSPERVIDEIVAFLRLNPSCVRVRFWDDTFPSRPGWIDRFASEYKRRIDRPFVVWLNPDTTREDNIRLLRLAGLEAVVVGIESASDRTRRLVFERTETREDILRADAILTRHGVRKMYDFLLDHPWESEDELESTYRLVGALRRPFVLNMHSLVLLPGTRLACRAVQEGRTTEREIIDAIIADPRVSARRIQWIRGVPNQECPERRFWIFLVLSAALAYLPRAATDLLANSALLRRHPGLLGGGESIGAWVVREDLGSKLSSWYARSGLLRRLLSARPRLRRKIKNAMLCSYWLCMVGGRLMAGAARELRG